MVQVEAKELEAMLALRADQRVPAAGIEYICVQGVEGLRDGWYRCRAKIQLVVCALVESLVNLASLRRRAVGDLWARCHRLRLQLRMPYCTLCVVEC